MQGRGSGILPHTDRVGEVLAEIARLHQAQGIDFSVKMRLGQESPNRVGIREEDAAYLVEWSA